MFFNFGVIFLQFFAYSGFGYLRRSLLIGLEFVVGAGAGRLLLFGTTCDEIYVANFKPVNMETYLAVSHSFLNMEPIKLYLCIFQTIKSILSYTMVMVSLYN